MARKPRSLEIDPDAPPPPEPDRILGVPHPRAVFDLFGHEDAEAQFLQAIHANQLHHAWLITGRRGVGKATLAYRFARHLLGAATRAGLGPLDHDPDDPVSRQIAQGAHPDLRVLRRALDDKREKLRGEIRVEEARAFMSFFGLSPGIEGGWRVAIIDCCDDLNRNSANALLKTLEEPPEKSVIFLIANSLGTLPPTIASRCRRLKLASPGEEACVRIGVRNGLSREDATRAGELAGHSPGAALQLAHDGRLQAFETLMRDLDQLADPRTSRALAEQAMAFAGNKDPEHLERFLDWCSVWARGRAQHHADEIDTAKRLSDAWFALADLRRDYEAINVDRTQTALAALRILRQTVERANISRDGGAG